MNAERAAKLKTVGIVIVGIAGLLSLFLLIFSFAAPDAAGSLGVGKLYLRADIDTQASAVSTFLKLRPALDAALLVGAYVFVCLALRAQESLRGYIKNREHF